ncbi:unnamed protein product, partial [Meganyctiphanes norvegica]
MENTLDEPLSSETEDEIQNKEKVQEWLNSNISELNETQDEVQSKEKVQEKLISKMNELKEQEVLAYLESHPLIGEKWLNNRGASKDRNTTSSHNKRQDGSSKTTQSNKSSISIAIPNSNFNSSECQNNENTEDSCLTTSDTQQLTQSNCFTKNNEKQSSSCDTSVTLKNNINDVLAKGLTDSELFMDIIKDTSTELDVDSLCHTILVNSVQQTVADRASLFVVQSCKGNQHLTAKLFDVTSESELDDSLTKAKEKNIIMPWGEGIVGHVASTKELVNIKDAYQDKRFDPSIDNLTGYKTMSMLCMPVCNYNGDVLGVAEILNKKNGSKEFSEQDAEIFQRYLAFCGIAIQNSQLFDITIQEYKKNQHLLQLARGIFEEQTSLDGLVKKIVKETLELMSCERCCFYLSDPQKLENLDKPSGGTESKNKSNELCQIGPPPDSLGQQSMEKSNFHMVFEMKATDKDCHLSRPSSQQLSESVHAQLANYVRITGQTVNIVNTDKWFGTTLEEDGFTSQSLLTVPLYSSSKNSKNILGVAQMFNKENGQKFSVYDIKTFESYALFCGIAIQNTQVYEKACRLMARQTVALDCLSYHASASQEDTDKLKMAEVPLAKYFDLYNFDFTETYLTNEETCKCTIRMFMELNLLNTFEIPYEVLCRWLLSVRKNYRPVKYHNWRHAVTVCQTMFAMLKTGKMERFMTELQMLGLLVACLCHDLDHRGTNNSFQTKTESPLAILYSTSTMEHHHFDQCVMILSQDSNNIFQGLSSDDYRQVMKVVESAILSTDMAMYFKKKNKFLELSDNGEFDWQSEEKKNLLCGMMMTACDVSAIAKPWEIQHKVAKLVADEFFEQGDLERLKLNEQPMAMMDREKKDELPKMQIGFIDHICLPLYKALSESFPWVKPLHDGCNRNKEHWVALAEQVDMGLTWIDHEYIEEPVERTNVEGWSKMIERVCSGKYDRQGVRRRTSLVEAVSSEQESKMIRIGSKGSHNLSRRKKHLGGSKKVFRDINCITRQSSDKRHDRVTDSSHMPLPCSTTTNPSLPLQKDEYGRNNKQQKKSHKLGTKFCVMFF